MSPNIKNHEKEIVNYLNTYRLDKGFIVIKIAWNVPKEST